MLDNQPTQKEVSQYREAREEALRAIGSDHVGLLVFTTSYGVNGGTDIDIISGIDSSSLSDGESDGQIRLNQAVMHIEYLADISGLSPMQVCSEIAKVIDRGGVEIEEAPTR